MIEGMMWSPMSWVVAALIYSALSWQRIRDLPWVRWPRRILGTVVLSVLIGWFVLGALNTSKRARQYLRDTKTGEQAEHGATQPVQAMEGPASGR